MTIFVHQELSVPWKVIAVWMMPRIAIPSRVPKIEP